MNKNLPKLLSFDDCLDETATLPGRSLLLGNGFSLASGLDQFSYKSLLREAEFESRDFAIREIFRALGTEDFENVGRALETSLKVVPAYERKPTIANSMKGDIEILRESLVKVISDVHPDNPEVIGKGKYKRVREFIRTFSNVFTLNYDLLLYWLRNRSDCDELGSIGDDGFRAYSSNFLHWNPECDSQNIFNLHGALHLFEDGLKIKKIKSKYIQPMLPKIQGYIHKGKFPLFVSESESRKKLSRIDRSPYLRHGLSQLKRVEGAVFVFGHSMEKSDEHIFDAINGSRASHVYVSIFGSPESEKNVEVVKNSRSYFGDNIKVGYFDVSSASAWS